MSSFLKNTVALSLLAALLYFAGVQELWAALSQLTLSAIGYLLLISFVLLYVSVLKWKLFLEFLSQKVSTVRLFQLYLVGYFVNLLVPSYVGGDAVRSFYAGKKSGQYEAAAATILERYTGIVALLLLAFVFMWQVEITTLPMKLAVVACLLALFGGTLLALSEKWSRVLLSVGPLKKLVPHLNKVREALHLARRNKLLLAKAMTLSFLYHGLTAVNTLAAAFAVGWFDPPVKDLFVVLPLILLIGALPISPSGLGLQEGAFYFFLQALGATPGQALGVAVVLRAKSYILAVLGWICWIAVRRSDRQGKPKLTPVDHPIS